MGECGLKNGGLSAGGVIVLVLFVGGYLPLTLSTPSVSWRYLNVMFGRSNSNGYSKFERAVM